MNQGFAKKMIGALASIACVVATSASAQTVKSISTFASGTAVGATAPDSITLSKYSVWVAYTNGTNGTGAGGNSTVVKYGGRGTILKTYSLAGSVDGLKFDPRTGDIWAMQNQDGNSTLTLIEREGEVEGPIPYAVTSATNGVDDAAFRGDQVFVSYTNPAAPTDPTIQLVKNGSNPIVLTPVLTMGATGTNLATGQTGQPTAQNDPDSLKLTPAGDLMLTSGDDGQLIFVHDPGTPSQKVSFLTLLDPISGAALAPGSGLDDAVIATSERATFFVTDTGNNRVLRIKVDEIPVGSLFAAVGGKLQEFGVVNRHTGKVYPVVSNLNAPHGVAFVPNTEDDDDEACR